MKANYVQRLRITYGKTGPARFIGHLDLARTLERSLNRARIPLAYSQGYNRRPRMQLASPLPLGFTSECEMVDIWLAEHVIAGEVKAAIGAKMAPGIIVHSVEEVDLRATALQNLTTSAVYHVTIIEPLDRVDLQQRIVELLANESLLRERKGKVYDLRPLVESLAMNVGRDKSGAILMRLSLLPGKTGRPDEVLEALGLDPLAARICRKELILVDETDKT